jgi:hypothetical protein
MLHAPLNMLLGVMKSLVILSGAVAFSLPGPIAAQSSLADIQQSHITANVPPSEAFDSLLRRDLLAFFQNSAVNRPGIPGDSNS